MNPVEWSTDPDGRNWGFRASYRTHKSGWFCVPVFFMGDLKYMTKAGARGFMEQMKFSRWAEYYWIGSADEVARVMEGRKKTRALKWQAYRCGKSWATMNNRMIAKILATSGAV